MVAELGKGSSTTVYSAVLEVASGVRRPVAVKLFSAVATDDMDKVLAVLQDAAERSAWISHPNVAAVHDFGLAARHPFLVSELVSGVTLASLVERFAVRDQRLPLDLALFVVMEVGEGLNGARLAVDDRRVHVNMLHLGLTMREVLLSWRGDVKVVDFGLSAARAASSSVRNARGLAIRTALMAPEVAQGDPGDARSDVFSLGMLARELLVGPRFPRGIGHAESVRFARDGYVEPCRHKPQLPEAVLRIVDRAIATDPRGRFPNASAMTHELRRATLAMGLGDGRYFLRRTLDREWGSDAHEVTKERPFSSAPPPIMPAPVEIIGPEDVEDVE